MTENMAGGNINLRGLRNYTAFREATNVELQQYHNTPPFRHNDLYQKGRSYQANVLFLRRLVEDLGDEFLGAVTVKSKTKEFSFFDLQDKIQNWLIGRVFANDWTTFCKQNRQPESQTAASHVANMRSVMLYFTKELETNSGRKSLFSLFAPSLQVAILKSFQVDEEEKEDLPDSEELYRIAMKIEKQSKEVRRIKQEFGLNRPSAESRVMPVLHEFPASSPSKPAQLDPPPVRINPRGLAGV